MNNPYEEMIDDLILEAEGLDFEDDELDDTISILSNGESDECIDESIDDIEGYDDDDVDDDVEDFINNVL